MGVTGLEPEHQELSQSIADTSTYVNRQNNGKSPRVQNQVQIMQKHPDLAFLIETWPDFPEHIKAAIKALIQTHNTEV